MIAMVKKTLAQKTAKQREAGRAVAKINNDALAFAERNREIVELPPGLETNLTMKRKRGARTDADVIDEICEMYAQGITITATSDTWGCHTRLGTSGDKKITVMRKSITRSLTLVTSTR